VCFCTVRFVLRKIEAVITMRGFYRTDGCRSSDAYTRCFSSLYSWHHFLFFSFSLILGCVFYIQVSYTACVFAMSIVFLTKRGRKHRGKNPSIFGTLRKYALRLRGSATEAATLYNSGCQITLSLFNKIKYLSQYCLNFSAYGYLTFK
jgi:hypothetical protein